MGRLAAGRISVLASGIALAAVLATSARAERLAVCSYSAADGLAGESVRAMLQDRRGFIWFGTDWGLARFDSLEFVNYGHAEGLPSPSVWKLVETADGRLWALTAGGLARAREDRRSEEPPFEPVPAGKKPWREEVDIAADPAGGIVIATDQGVYRSAGGDPPRFDRVDIGEPPRRPGGSAQPSNAVAFDQKVVSGSRTRRKSCAATRRESSRCGISRRTIPWYRAGEAVPNCA